MNYLGNAFSLQMLQDDFATINVAPISREDLPLECYSVIGHQDLADYLGYPMNRVNTKLSRIDTLYVAQFVGGRLPEGTSILNSEELGLLKFFRIDVEYPLQLLQAQDMLENPENYGLI